MEHWCGLSVKCWILQKSFAFISGRFFDFQSTKLIVVRSFWYFLDIVFVGILNPFETIWSSWHFLTYFTWLILLSDSIRSFNDKPVNEASVGPIGRDLFMKEQDDLLADLIDIPKKACDRRV